MKNPQDFFTIYSRAAWDRDFESMIRLYDDNVLIYDMWTHGYQNGLAVWSGVIKDWLGSLGEERVKATFEMTEIHESGDLGFGTALITYEAIAPDNTILRSMKNRLTIGLQKKGDVWKVIHQHTSAPIDSELVANLNF